MAAVTTSGTKHLKEYELCTKESPDSSQNAATSGTAKEGQSLFTSFMCLLGSWTEDGRRSQHHLNQGVQDSAENPKNLDSVHPYKIVI